MYSETISIKSCFSGSFVRESEALNDFDTVLRILKHKSSYVHMFRKHDNNLVINNRGSNTIHVHHHKVTDGFAQFQFRS